jgi:anti-sigma factor (TIGR02949 family)
MTLFDSFKRLFFSGRGNGAERVAGPGAITCEDALRLVHEFLDGELEGVSRAEVEAHFEVCKRCYPHLRLERRFRDALRRACARETAPPELRTRILALVAEGRPNA